MFDDDMAEAEAERQARIRAERLARWEATTPAEFAGKYPMHPDVVRWVAGLVEGRRTNLALVGGTGTTKTWHCYAAIRQAYSAGFLGQAVLLDPAQWRRIITPPLDFDHLDKLAAADVLILDDLGASRIFDRDQENLLLILNGRWKHRRPTVITSNVADLREMVGERVSSRLADHILVELDGPDRRREA